MGTSLYFFWHRLLLIGQVLGAMWEMTKLIGQVLEAMWEIVSGTLLHLLAAAAAIE